MKLRDINEGDLIDYTPRICKEEHESLKGAPVTMIAGPDSIFNQTMIVCSGTNNGWMPLRECELSEEQVS